MKKILNGIMVICITFLVASNAAALIINPDDEITMGVSNDANHPYYLTHSGTTYTAFCLEMTHFFSVGPTYYVQSVGDYATDGSGGREWLDIEQAGGFSYVGYADKVEEETKWLYAAFVGQAFSNIENAATLVQHAIWFLEDEYDEGTIGYYIAQEEYRRLTNINFDASGWDIVAVNFSSAIDGSVDNQSQLIGVAPVPEPATMLLLGTGLIGLAGFGRKKFLK